jgi:hypothetical protein
MIRFHTAAAVVIAVSCLTGPAPAGVLPVTTGLVFWVDSSNVDGSNNSTLTNGSNVALWKNLAGGADATTASNYPVFRSTAGDLINGHPVIRFNGTNDNLSAGAIAGLTTDKTLFAVYKTATTGGSACCGTVIQGGEWNDLGAVSVGGGVYRAQLDINGSVAQGTTNIAGIAILGVANFDSAGQQLYVNGRLEATRNGGQTQLTNIVRLGYRNSQQYDGDIAEALVYNGVLTSTQRVQVSGYLARKYALPFTVDEKLSDTSQVVVDPFADGGLRQIGVNFYYAPGGETSGTLHGVAFDNIALNGTTPPTGPFNLSANSEHVTMTLAFPNFTGDNGARTQNLAAAGPDAATLNTVANEFFYVGTSQPEAIMTFSGLDPSKDLYVQVIGGDPSWGPTSLLVTANGATVGTWTTAADNNVDTAAIFGFFTKSTLQGTLTLDFTVASGTYAGIAGLIITEAVPEPGTMALLGLGGLTLVPIIRRRRRV